LEGTVLEGTVPHLEFTIEFSSNDLTYEQHYSKRQEMTYQLIVTLMNTYDIGYRKVSRKLNEWGIKTERGNQWFPSSVYSVLKRRHERDSRICNQRHHEYETKVSPFELKYYSFDKSE
jgi:hypothetical protein